MPGADGMTAPAGKPCPICSKLAIMRYHPFCSKRCADIDLGRWLKGAYVMPGDDEAGLADENDATDDGIEA